MSYKFLSGEKSLRDSFNIIDFLAQNPKYLMTQKKRWVSENIVSKEKNAGFQHFLLYL